jgi:hypothetical protein
VDSISPRPKKLKKKSLRNDLDVQDLIPIRELPNVAFTNLTSLEPAAVSSSKALAFPGVKMDGSSV